MTDLDTGPSSIRDDSICESSLNPNKSSGDIGELKPCPFCGGKPRMHIYQTSEDSEGAHVECTGCGAQTEATDDAYADTLTAAHIWNTRTPDPESAAEIESLRREKEDDHRRIKSLSEALLAARPLGGSELFVRWGDKYHADPAFFKDALERDRARYHETMKRAVIAEKKLATAESAVAAAWEEAAKIAETVPMGMENHPQKIASAIRAAGGGKKGT